MDLDVYVNAHRAEWDRLEHLLGRGRRLTGAEADELVALYQRTSTHLSAIQSSAPDPALTAHLTRLVARARSTVTGTRRASWRDAAHFLTAGSRGGLPLAPLVDPHGGAVGRRRGGHRVVDRHPPGGPGRDRGPRRAARDDPARGQYETYYSSNPATSFAAQVWTNNARAAALCLALGAFLGVPVLWVLLINMLNLGVGIGLMATRRAAWTPSSAWSCPTACWNSRPSSSPPRHRPALGLDGHRPRPAHPPRSPRRARPRRHRHGHRPRPGAVRLGRDRGLRDPVRPPHLGRISIGVLAELAFLLYVYVLGGRAARER